MLLIHFSWRSVHTRHPHHILLSTTLAATYPLDLCRARLSIASASILPVAANTAAAALQAAPLSTLSRALGSTPTSTAAFTTPPSSSLSPSSTTSARPVLQKLTPSPSAGRMPAATSTLSTLAPTASSAINVASRRLASEAPGMWGTMVKIYTEEGGIRALYRGIVPTAVGVAPYVVSSVLGDDCSKPSVNADGIGTL